SDRLGVEAVAFFKIGNLSGFTDKIVKLLVTVAGVVENSFRTLLGFVAAETKRVGVTGIDYGFRPAQNHLELPIAANVHIAGMLEIIDFGLYASGGELLLENLIFFLLAGARDDDDFEFRTDTRFLQQRLHLGGIPFDLGKVLHEPGAGFRNPPDGGRLAKSPVRALEELARIQGVERGVAYLNVIKRRLSDVEYQAAEARVLRFGDLDARHLGRDDFFYEGVRRALDHVQVAAAQRKK